MAKDKLENILSFKEYGELKKFDKGTKHTEIGGDVVNEKKKGCSACDEKKKKGGKKEMPQFILDAIQKKKDRLASEKKGGKKTKHIKEFADFGKINNDFLLNEGIEFSEEFKEKAQAFVNKYRNQLAKLLAPFRNCKSVEEVEGMLQQKAGNEVSEGVKWDSVKRILSKSLGIASNVTTSLGLLSGLFSMYQSVMTNSASQYYVYSGIAMAATMIFYIGKLVFSPSENSQIPA